MAVKLQTDVLITDLQNMTVKMTIFRVDYF